MITNWFKISLRVLFTYRLYTGINLIGLAIAISSFWYIADFVKNSHQYDVFHQNSNKIYRLTMEVTAGGSTDHYASTGKPPGRLLSMNYAGISDYAKMAFQGNTIVKINGELFDEKVFFSVNPGTLNVFTFDFLAGDKATCLSNPNSVLLSRFLAEKYFNSVDIIDKQITIGENQYSVKGVFEDWPENSHLSVNALLYKEVAASNYDPQDWFDLEQFNYVLLDPATSQNDLNNKLEQLTAEHVTPILEGSGIEVKFHSQPLDNLYFEPGLIDDVPKGNSKYVSALAFAGLFVFFDLWFKLYQSILDTIQQTHKRNYIKKNSWNITQTTSASKWNRIIDHDLAGIDDFRNSDIHF